MYLLLQQAVAFLPQGFDAPALYASFTYFSLSNLLLFYFFLFGGLV